MRKPFIDTLRWIVILLLVPYHAAQAFNTWGELNYVLFSPNKAISSGIVFLSPFYMPLMFLLAGMSARYALRKRTWGQFLLERVKRLMIPFVFGTLTLCPILSYIGDRTNLGYTGSFSAHYRIFFTKWTDFTGFDGGFGVGQFWFLIYLFVISVVGVGIVVFAKLVFKAERNEWDMPFWALCLFVVPLPFLYDLFSIGGKSFAEYLYVFLVGYYVLSNDAILEKAEKYRYAALLTGLAAGAVNVYMFIWSGKGFGPANTIAKALAEWFMILALTGMGKSAMDRPGKVSAYLSQRAFLVFSLHFVWVVLFQYWLSSLLGTNAFLLYLVPVLLAYLASFVNAEVCFRLPALCFLMGAKSHGGAVK